MATANMPPLPPRWLLILMPSSVVLPAEIPESEEVEAEVRKQQAGHQQRQRRNV
jgi:hypothetical protein